jgi:hypothetical protein
MNTGFSAGKGTDPTENRFDPHAVKRSIARDPATAAAKIRSCGFLRDTKCFTS